MTDFYYDGAQYDSEDLDVMIAPVLAYMARCVSETNHANGWYDANRTFGDGIALIHSEVSEALEAFRDNGMAATIREDGKPEGVPSEFADILVRLLDESERQQVDLGVEFIAKSAYNERRGYRHGGRAL